MINEDVVIVMAPWTPGEVDALNRWQGDGWVHPFTCGKCRDRLGIDGDDRALIATENGWVCRTCDYTQDWAHKTMLNPPTNPFTETKQEIIDDSGRT